MYDSFNLGFSMNESQIKLLNKYNLSNKHKLKYGVSSKIYKVSPGSIAPSDEQSSIVPLTIDKEKAIESAVFFSDKYSINERLQVNFGLRYSFYSLLGPSTQKIYDASLPMIEESVIGTRYYENNKLIKKYFNPEVRIAARYLINSDLSLKMGYDRTIQYTHMLSGNTTASPVDTWKLSNINIKPQKSDQFSIGVFQQFENNKYELSLESYYKKMDGILDFRIGAETILNKDIETVLLRGKGKAYGIEFLLKKEGDFSGWFGYSYSKSLMKFDSEHRINQVNKGQYFPSNYDKPHDFSLIGNYKLTHRYSFSMNVIYQTGRPITYPVGKYEFAGVEHVLYSDRNKFRIPDYYRLDLGINIEGSHKIKKLSHSFWSFSVYNVLGRNNPYSVFFINKEGDIHAYKTSIFAVPVPTITYNIKF